MDEHAPDRGSKSPVEAFTEAMLTVDDAVPTVGDITREHVDGSEWERVVYWVEDDDGFSSRVRHVRHYRQTGTVVIARVGGLDSATTMEALPDIDRLVQAIHVGGET